MIDLETPVTPFKLLGASRNIVLPHDNMFNVYHIQEIVQVFENVLLFSAKVLCWVWLRTKKKTTAPFF